MIAITIPQFGGPEALKPTEVPTPVAGPGELLIEVKAAGVARADTLQRQGKYPPPAGASSIPGLDVAGMVAEVGPGVDGFRLGDRVCAILAGGGYAQYCAAPAQQVLPIPDNWNFVQTTTLPENLFTVYDNVVTRAGLSKGETILIHGGTSGIGSTAIMLARALACTAIATAGSDQKCQACLSLGAAYAINYKSSDFVADVKRFTADRGVDVVLDMVGGPYLGKNIDCLAMEGRLTIVATQAGRTGDLDIAKLMQKRARVMGSTMRVRSPEQKGQVAAAVFRHVWPLLPPKDPIRPLVDTTFPLDRASDAHRRMESGEHIGKIVLVPIGSSHD